MNTTPTTVHYASIYDAQLGDTVSIGGILGTVTQIQLVKGGSGPRGELRIVHAGSHKIEADGEGSHLIDVIEL
jgi:hypothetical protein